MVLQLVDVHNVVVVLPMRVSQSRGAVEATSLTSSSSLLATEAGILLLLKLVQGRMVEENDLLMQCAGGRYDVDGRRSLRC